MIFIDGPFHKRQMAANTVCRFVSLIVGDKILFVGEGNFSFFEVSGPVPFNPADFPGYEHTNTNDDESAIEDHDRFGTWVFNPVK